MAALSLLISAVYAGTYFATPFLKEKQNNPDAAAALKNEGNEAADIIRDYIDKQSVESLIRKKKTVPGCGSYLQLRSFS